MVSRYNLTSFEKNLSLSDFISFQIKLSDGNLIKWLKIRIYVLTFYNLTFDISNDNFECKFNNSQVELGDV